MATLAVDTETTGTDFWHGCKPFMVTACNGKENFIWSGEVNSCDRADVYWKKEDLYEIEDVLDDHPTHVFHNAKFDFRALSTIGVKLDWSKIEDTMLASHVLCSGDQHKLKYLAFKYLDYYNENEKTLSREVQRARLNNKVDDIAKEGHHCFPALRGSGVKWHKMDYWLCMEECAEYGCDDVEMTWLLWKMFEDTIIQLDLEEQYETRKALLPITYRMEEVGYHFYGEDVEREVIRQADKQEELRLLIQDECKFGFHLNLQKARHLHFLFFDALELPVHDVSEKTGVPSLNAEAIDYYIQAYPQNKPIQHFAEYRKYGKQRGSLEGYLQWSDSASRLHPNVLITGTRETRQSIIQPATQTIDKRLRYIFGPDEGYVWLDYDLVNIEMRIWGYAVGNPEMVELFDANQNFHLVVSEMLYPDKFKECLDEGEPFKVRYKETLYQWVKNGNFSIIYGAGKKKADRTYQLDGAYYRVIKRFPEVPHYTRSVIKEVEDNNNRYGVPFLTCLGGYKLEVPIDQLHTKACNYKTQGAAGYVINLSMIEVAKNPDYISAKAEIINQVHDSLPIEVPLKYYSPALAESIKRSIEKGGEKLLPTCEAELEKVIYHPHEVPQ